MPYKNIEDKKKNNKEYQKNNREHINERARERYADDPKYKKKILNSTKKWTENNKEKNLETKKRYRVENREVIQAKAQGLLRKFPWLAHYRCAKRRCVDLNHRVYRWYGGRGIKMLLTKKDIEIL